MANSNLIQNHCQFKIAEAREKIFKLSENTWAVYSIGMISTNEVCPAANAVTATLSGSNPDPTFDVISADESETIEVAIKTLMLGR